MRSSLLLLPLAAFGMAGCVGVVLTLSTANVHHRYDACTFRYIHDTGTVG